MSCKCVLSVSMKHAPQADLSARVNRNVKILLARDGMSRRDLADALGYDPAQVSRSLSGLREWKLADIGLLAQVFAVTVALLLDDPDTLVRNSCFRPVLVSA